VSTEKGRSQASWPWLTAASRPFEQIGWPADRCGCMQCAMTTPGPRRARVSKLNNGYCRGPGLASGEWAVAVVYCTCDTK
jgi:hypothetical protein